MIAVSRLTQVLTVLAAGRVANPISNSAGRVANPISNSAGRVANPIFVLQKTGTCAKAAVGPVCKSVPRQVFWQKIADFLPPQSLQ